jgi:undecaprenyl-diphosphatase
VDLIQVIVLALVQGLTEILPISSSGHLILVPVLFGWPDQGLGFDVAMHMGTLAALLWYFRGEVQLYSRAALRSLAARRLDAESRLAWAIAAGTVPAVLFGLYLEQGAGSALRSATVVATTTVVYALLLGTADLLGAKRRDETTVGFKDALIIGAAQALALIPGTSRSGITMTAGLALGLDRKGAARFSFLLSLPITAAAGAFELAKLLHADAPQPWLDMLLGAAVAGLATYACVAVLLRFIQRIGMWPFVAYRLLLGAALGLALWRGAI